MNLRPEQILKLLANEAFHYRKVLVIAFFAINLAMLGLGLIWPKGFTSTTTILVEDKKIIQPLMQGAAVATEVTDRSRLAREVILGRKVMNQVLEDSGWMKTNPTPTEQEKIIERITKRTTITVVGKDIIKIEYKDDDAQRAFKTTKKFADEIHADGYGKDVGEVVTIAESLLEKKAV